MASQGPTLKAGYGKTVDLSYDEAVSRAEKALAQEGFGILTRIDVKATMKQKLGIDRPRLEILGACNPPLAHKALSANPEVSVLMPCNVVVRELEDGKTRVDVMNAQTMSQLFPEPELEEVAADVKRRLDRVLDSI